MNPSAHDVNQSPSSSQPEAQQSTTATASSASFADASSSPSTSKPASHLSSVVDKHSHSGSATACPKDPQPAATHNENDRTNCMPSSPADGAGQTTPATVPNANNSNSSNINDSNNALQSASLSADSDMMPDPEVALRVKWGGSLYAVELPLQSTIADLKRRLFELTEVQPKRQKVLGLPSTGSRLPDDALKLHTLNLKPDQRIMLVGSREADISAANAAYLNIDTDVINDLDVDYDPEDGTRRVLRDEATYLRRLERRIETTEVRIMNEPRQGKRLLVLDLDYTLFDCRSNAPTIAELGRPGLHRFLASTYQYYDIVVWSQTSWRWLEAKLTGLSMLFSEHYKLSFVLDRTSMFSVTSQRNGQERTHEVKALEIIWRKFPGRWSAHNTIHIDDLSKNFALNPQSGLKIAPFKNAPVTRQTDRELFYLEHYLKLIAQHESDFTKLKHKHWKRYCSTHDPSNSNAPNQSS